MELSAPPAPWRGRWQPSRRCLAPPIGVAVVLPEGIPKAVQLAADRFDVFRGGHSAVFGILDELRPRRGRVAEAGQVERHSVSPSLGAAPDTIAGALFQYALARLASQHRGSGPTALIGRLSCASARAPTSSGGEAINLQLYAQPRRPHGYKPHSDRCRHPCSARGSRFGCRCEEKESQTLEKRFGPEYDRAVEELGSRPKAEAELKARQKRVEQLHIVPLAPAEARRFSESWRVLQGRFVDNPKDVLVDADLLVRELMQKRGYPMGDFDQPCSGHFR